METTTLQTSMKEMCRKLTYLGSELTAPNTNLNIYFKHVEFIQVKEKKFLLPFYLFPEMHLFSPLFTRKYGSQHWYWSQFPLIPNYLTI